MSVYENLVRPALFTLPPDLTHAIGHIALRRVLPWRMLAAVTAFDVDDPVLKTSFAGIDLASPVGLAAGFHKDCELIGALSVLGFGFLTVGSIMPQPRPGHPYPRLVRYAETESLADSIGLPSRRRGTEFARRPQGPAEPRPRLLRRAPRATRPAPGAGLRQYRRLLRRGDRGKPVRGRTARRRDRDQPDVPEYAARRRTFRRRRPAARHPRAHAKPA